MKGVKPPMPPLRVSGKYLVDANGNIARYRGAMQSLTPFFCSGRWGGGGFTFRNVATCRYLGSEASPCSTSPVVWSCISRMER